MTVKEKLQRVKEVEATKARIKELETENNNLREILKEAFDLLEQHQPNWYLRGLYKKIVAVLAATKENRKNKENGNT